MVILPFSFIPSKTTNRTIIAFNYLALMKKISICLFSSLGTFGTPLFYLLIVIVPAGVVIPGIFVFQKSR
jgi:hypothetical protein